MDFDALQRLSSQEAEASTSVSPVYADGVQVNHVTGEVIRWRKDTEVAERFDAQNYIRSCEREIATLRDQVKLPSGSKLQVVRLTLIGVFSQCLYSTFPVQAVSISQIIEICPDIISGFCCIFLRLFTENNLCRFPSSSTREVLVMSS